MVSVRPIMGVFFEAKRQEIWFTFALEDHDGTISTGGRTITNLRFVDDIGGLAGQQEELAKLAERLDKASTD